MIISDRAKWILTFTFAIIMILALLTEGAARIWQYLKKGTTSDSSSIYLINHEFGSRIAVPNTKTKSITIYSQGFSNFEVQSYKVKMPSRLAILGGATTFFAVVSYDVLTWPHIILVKFHWITLMVVHLVILLSHHIGIFYLEINPINRLL